jgi:hypothetical protein
MQVPWKRKLPVGVATVRGIRFLGSQEGHSERRFMEAVAEILRGTVERAYLARVEYRDNAPSAVALCLRSTGSQESLVESISAIFSRMFGREQHLDIMFLTEDQEHELACVCRPFFESERDRA